MAQDDTTLSLGGKPSATENDTAQVAISERPPRQDQNERPPRLRNLRNLLLRDNVDFVLCVGGVDTMRVGVKFSDGAKDAKSFRVGDTEGCFVIMHLRDNPEHAGVGFYDLKIGEKT